MWGRNLADNQFPALGLGLAGAGQRGQGAGSKGPPPGVPGPVPQGTRSRVIELPVHLGVPAIHITVVLPAPYPAPAMAASNPTAPAWTDLLDRGVMEEDVPMPTEVRIVLAWCWAGGGHPCPLGRLSLMPLLCVPYRRNCVRRSRPLSLSCRILCDHEVRAVERRDVDAGPCRRGAFLCHRPTLPRRRRVARRLERAHPRACNISPQRQGWQDVGQRALRAAPRFAW